MLNVEYEPAIDGEQDAEPAKYKLTHGQIQHGFQYDDVYWKTQPTTYYGKESGVGHFGNLLGYEHAVKSVITDSFTGNGHFIKTCRGAYSEKMASLSYYAVEPTMKKVTAYKMRGVKAAAARKDW